MSFRPFALVAPLIVAVGASAQTFVTDLGTLPGGTSSHGYKINDSGMVVGFSMTGQGARAFAWTRQAGMTNLGVLRNDPSSFGLGLSNDGRVVGYSGSAVHRTAFEWTATGGMRDLGTFGADPISLGLSVNGAGQFVGLSGSDSGTKRAFMYTQATGMMDLGFVPGRTSSFARDINDLGRVVGHSAGPDSLAFHWQSSTGMSALQLYGGGSTSGANAINAFGKIAGWATDSTGRKRAVVWNSFTGIPVAIDNILPGINSAEALDIGDDGTIVGTAKVGSLERAWVYRPQTGAKWLESAIGYTGSDWVFQRAQGINAEGEIVGYGLHNGQTRAFVTSAVPEPATGLVLLLGSWVALARRRR